MTKTISMLEEEADRLTRVIAGTKSVPSKLFFLVVYISELWTSMNRTYLQNEVVFQSSGSKV